MKKALITGINGQDEQLVEIMAKHDRELAKQEKRAIS